MHICQPLPFLSPPRCRHMHGSDCLRDLGLDLLEDVLFGDEKKMVYTSVENEYTATRQQKSYPRHGLERRVV